MPSKARITSLHSRIVNIRKEQLHKASATISKSHAIVVMEDLRIRKERPGKGGMRPDRL